MRIALVATGGFDRSRRERIIPALVWLVERLARRHTVVVYVLRYHDLPCRYPLAGAMVHDLGRPEGVWRQYRALLRAVRADGPFDLLHGYWGHPAGLVAALAARRLGVPSVVTCDSGEFVALDDIGYGLQRSWRGRAAIAAATRLASCITVCSRYQARLAERHGVVPAVIPLGVNLSAFGASRSPDRAGPFRLLTVASINPVKDHDTALLALCELNERRVSATLDIVGEDTLRGRVLERADALGLRDQVVFHGFLPTDRLAVAYQAADLFVLPSRHEAAGVVVLEAAAAKLPVVGSDVGYVADWSPDMAVAVPPGNPAALAAAIAALRDDPAARERMAARAYEWVRTHDAEWTADRFDDLYGSLVSTHRRDALPARRSRIAPDDSQDPPPAA